MGEDQAPAQHVIIVGVGPLTELYLESAARYGSKTVAVVGILSDQTEFSGRLIGSRKYSGRWRSCHELLIDSRCMASPSSASQ